MDYANLSFNRTGHRPYWMAFAIGTLTLMTVLAPAMAQQKPATPAEALVAADVCRETFDNRTQLMSISNRTNWTVEIVFFQGLDESNLVPPGFITNTGVFVAGLEQPGPSVVAEDPCHSGAGQRPIQATRGRASIVLRHPISGENFGMNLPDMNGDTSAYWENVHWEVGFSPVSRKDGKPVIEARIVGKRKKS